MRKRPPPFALVLSLLLAGAGIAVLLASSGGAPASRGGEPTIGVGPSRACARTQARAEVTARSAIVINATARAPVRVTERATGPSGTATVTRSEVVTARLRVSQPVAVKHVTAARAGACANAASSIAAHDAALRRAYAIAVGRAHGVATRAAPTALRALMRRLYPSVLRHAQARASARAHQLALGAASALAVQARAEARRRAGA